jgi:hypothetical protein
MGQLNNHLSQKRLSLEPMFQHEDMQRQGVVTADQFKNVFLSQIRCPHMMTANDCYFVAKKYVQMHGNIQYNAFV